MMMNPGANEPWGEHSDARASVKAWSTTRATPPVKDPVKDPDKDPGKERHRTIEFAPQAPP